MIRIAALLEIGLTLTDNCDSVYVKGIKPWPNFSWTCVCPGVPALLLLPLRLLAEDPEKSEFVNFTWGEGIATYLASNPILRFSQGEPPTLWALHFVSGAVPSHHVSDLVPEL